jgi:hypothetical protein
MSASWFSLLAALVAFVVAFLFYKKKQRLRLAGKTLFASVFVLGLGYLIKFLLQLIDADQEWFVSVELCWLLSVTLILTTLANILRDDKPVFARYPLSFTFLPIIILPFYPFIYNTTVIKNWILGLYQIGAIVISLLLFGLMYYRDHSFKSVIMTWALFFFAWLVHWFSLGQFMNEWLTPLLIGIGMILGLNAFKQVSILEN